MSELKPKDMPRQVDDLAITCMDFRFPRKINQILQDKHGVELLDIDHLAIGGSSMGVVDGSLLQSLEIGLKKHGVKNIYLFDHTDCGGFGGQAAYDNNERKEAEDHFESLDRAQQAIREIMPEVVIVSYVIGLDGEPIER